MSDDHSVDELLERMTEAELHLLAERVANEMCDGSEDDERSLCREVGW